MRTYGFTGKGKVTIQKVVTMPTWTAEDEGRLVWDDTANILYVGGNTGWVSATGAGGTSGTSGTSGAGSGTSGSSGSSGSSGTSGVGTSGSSGTSGTSGQTVLADYRRLNSNYTVVFASGTVGDLNAILGIKTVDGATLKIAFNKPTTVKYYSIKHMWESTETSGIANVEITIPEPNGETDLMKSARPIMYRLNAIQGVAATGGTIVNDSGNLKITMTGYTAGQDFGFVIIF